MILKSSTSKIKVLCLACLLGVLTACAATEGSVNNPFLRKFQWFSYVEGGDFRNACVPDRYRMIYNAVYTEQVRIYDVTTATGELRTRIINTTNVKDLENVEKWQKMWDPWRGTITSTTLSDTDLNDLVDDLERSGAFGPPNVGEELSSKGFYWTIASCRNGQYHFTAVAWPSEKWADLSFADRLFALDSTGLAVNEPRKTKTSRRFGKTQLPGGHAQPEFHLKVGKNGLAGVGSLF